MNVTGVMKSIQGKRPFQQDRCGFMQIKDNAFLVVADGNGGTGGCELANTAVKSVISECCLRFSEKENARITSADSLEKIGLEIVDRAAKEVMCVKKANNWDRAGTTITLLTLNNKFVAVFWLGDSPAYIYRRGAVENLITPHTLAEELIKNGQSRESVKQQKSIQSILTQCAGHEPYKPEAKVIENELPCFVMAGSDGLSGFLDEEAILTVVQENLFSSVPLQEICDALVARSYLHGSDDNITLVMAKYYKNAGTNLEKKLDMMHD